MKKEIVILCLLVLLSLIALPVNAEVATGDLGFDGINSTTYFKLQAGASAAKFYALKFDNIENSGNLEAIVRFNVAYNDTCDSNAPIGAQTPVKIYMTNTTTSEFDAQGRPTYWEYYSSDDANLIGTGQIGYMRQFNSAVPPVETTGGFVYITFDTWNVTGYTGDKVVYLNYSINNLYNITSIGQGTGNTAPDNLAYFFSGNNVNTAGTYIYNKYTTAWSTYSAEKPKGLRIEGYVFKHKSDGATLYNSRAFIFNASGGTLVSDYTSNSNWLYFNVPNEQIKIGMLAPTGVFYNSSLLFNGTTNTTPTGVATRFTAYDGTGYGFIQNVTIDVYNHNYASWTNGTYSSGSVTIYTNTSTELLSAYGTKTGYYPAKYLNAPSDGTPYSLVFYQEGAPPLTGWQFFYVNTLNPSGERISGVNVNAIKTGTSNTSSAVSTASGVATLHLNTSTLYSITASKSGYVGASLSVTTSTALSDSVTMVLTPTTITQIPTATPNPTQTPSGTLSTCGSTLSANATVLDIFKNNIACFGVNDLEGQNFTLAAIIILCCAMILGKYGKGDGAAIGAIIGFILSFAMKLIPFYLLVLAFALIGAFFANKFLGSK